MVTTIPRSLRVLLFVALVLAPLHAAQVKFTDPMGRAVLIPASIQRAVCIGQGCLRMVSYLQATDRIVGVEQQETKTGITSTRPYLDANPRLRKLPPIGPGTKGDAELIIAQNPQVIFWANGSVDAMDRMQKKTGIPVIGFQAGDFAQKRATFLASLHVLGHLLGKAARADSIEIFLQAQTKELRQLGKQIVNSPRVYVGGLAFQGCHGLSATHPAYSPFVLLGLPNVASGISTLDGNPVRVDAEQILAWNPQHIFVDQACQESVGEDFARSTALRKLQPRVHAVWPSNSYGDNWELTLANAFKIAYHLLSQGNADAKRSQILRFLLNYG